MWRRLLNGVIWHWTWQETDERTAKQEERKQRGNEFSPLLCVVNV